MPGGDVGILENIQNREAQLVVVSCSLNREEGRRKSEAIDDAIPAFKSTSHAPVLSTNDFLYNMRLKV